MAFDPDIDGQPVHTRHIKILASAALLLIGFFAAVVITFHFLNRGYDPSTSFISEYAVGRYGVLMSIGFISLSIGSLLLVAGLYQAIPNDGRSIPGLILLGVWSLCVFIAGIFNTDVQGSEQTAYGQMHDNASLIAFIAIVIGSFLMLRFKRNDDWQPFYQTSLLISIFMALAFADFIISLIIKTSSVGIVQRVFVGIVIIWLMIIAKRLLSL